MLNYSKAAMFGLDARIALAIFGVLSIISGAALFSAVQNSKATALIANLNELGKAWEQYYLDTNSNLPTQSTDTSSDDFYLLKSSYLVDNSADVEGWDGPYISYTLSSVSGFLNNANEDGYAQIVLLKNEDWGSGGWRGGTCTSGNQCSIWSRLSKSGEDQTDLAKAIDLIVDGEVDSVSGNFRWYVNGSNDTEFNLKYAPIANPND